MHAHHGHTVQLIIDCVSYTYDSVAQLHSVCALCVLASMYLLHMHVLGETLGNIEGHIHLIPTVNIIY